MRRLVHSLLAASSVALLSACGQGGSAFNVSGYNKVDHVFISSAGQPPGTLKVIPGGTLVLSAVGVKGSQNSIVVSDTRYTWNYSVAPAGTPYQGGNSAQDGFQGFCNGVTGAGTPPATALTFGQTNGGGINQDTAVLVAPTVAALGPTAAIAPFVDPAGNRPNAGNLAASYCLIVNATHVIDGVVGSNVVYVGN